MFGLADYAKATFSLAGLYTLAHRARWRAIARRYPVYSRWNIDHSAVFIHVPKTAGTAIQELFGIGRIDNGPHIPAYAYQWSDPAFFSRAYKFSVVRNPWDRLVSAFHYLKASPWRDDQIWSQRHLRPFHTFQAFASGLEDPIFRNVVLTQLHFHPQSDFLTDADGRLCVDRVIEFGALEAGLRDVAGQLGMDFHPVSRRNASRHRDYREYYDARSQALVERLYRKDIARFGFDYDGRRRGDDGGLALG